MTTRRDALRWAALTALGIPALTAGCGSEKPAKLYHDGRLFIATGNPTGTYYQLGGGLADVISRYLPGYEARAEPTGASGENIERVASGDMDLAFTLADVAADAVRGRDAFNGRPQNIKALTRIYRNHTHLVARADAKISKLADLAGKRVSTGSLNSGTDIIGGRLMAAAGVDPDKGVVRQRLSLADTVRQMKDVPGAPHTTDAMFFSGGLPVPGIADMFKTEPGKYVLVPIDDALPKLKTEYGAAYDVKSIPKASYGTSADVPTIVVQNMIVISPAMPDDLAYNLVKVLFEHKTELAEVHAEAANIDRAAGVNTDPVPVHPGSERYLRSA